MTLKADRFDAFFQELWGKVSLIQFGGHLPKGGYDVDHGGHEDETVRRSFREEL